MEGDRGSAPPLSREVGLRGAARIPVSHSCPSGRVAPGLVYWFPLRYSLTVFRRTAILNVLSRMRDQIDEIDARILEILQESGRTSLSDIAEDVGLSVPSVSDRVHKLEDQNVITGYHARVNAKRIHRDITAFIRLHAEGSENYDEIVREAAEVDDVLELHSITGEGSHIMKVRTENTTTLERLLSQIQNWPGVHGTSTSIVLSSFKETATLPVEPTDLYTVEEEQGTGR